MQVFRIVIRCIMKSIKYTPMKQTSAWRTLCFPKLGTKARFQYPSSRISVILKRESIPKSTRIEHTKTILLLSPQIVLWETLEERCQTYYRVIC